MTVYLRVTLAHLKDRPTQASSHSPLSPGVTGGMKSAGARMWCGGNCSRALGFVGGNGGTKSVIGSNGKVGTLGASTSNYLMSNSNYVNYYINELLT